MKQLLERNDFQIHILKEEVFRFLDCQKDSPVYEVIEEEWENWKEEAENLVTPAAIFVMDKSDRTYDRKDLEECEEVIFLFQTIGDGLSSMSSKLFSQGDALGGMLLDAMANAALTDLAKQVSQWLKDICKERKIGIVRRLEAAHQLPMEAQQWIMEKTEADKRLGIELSSGYMYHPVKSGGCVLIPTSNTEMFHDQHNCRRCGRKGCKMRNIQPVKIILEGKEYISREDESILDTLTKSGEAFSFPCGGRGTCGKCKIQLLEGELPVSTEDEKFFSKEELEQGYRLACKAFPTENCVIRFCGDTEEEFEVLGDVKAAMDSSGDADCVQSSATGECTEKQHIDGNQKPYCIAIDIGTTTLAVSLVESSTGNSVQVHTAINRQRRFGADVISRIQASCEGKGSQLQQSIREDLLEGIQTVMKQGNVAEEDLEMISIAGNTTMGHLLMGLSCETLGVYPFTPVDISMRKLEFAEVFGEAVLHVPVLLLPGISTYVGADITAGMLTCGFAREEKVSLLIDLGTNGEMAIGNKDKILVTSTAAGPAFEGGNISCGVGSVAGAISDVVIEESGNADGAGVTVTTIGDKAPVGLCGTGVIAMVAELLRNELVDETGLLDEDYFDDGFPIVKDVEGNELTFTQKDVREMQLAKAAVRAGLETLLLRYGTDYDGIDKVYIAGGFGYKLDLQKAAAIGLLPEELLSKVEAVGNSSLAGAKEAVLGADAMEEMKHICYVSEEVNLSSDKDFNEFYMEAMMFE